MNGRAIALGLLVLGTFTACRRSPPESPAVELTATSTRTARRAFDGAPPVIPHKPLGAKCTTCHTERGEAVPDLGMAPANPHGMAGGLSNCRQCHLFKHSEDQFRPTQFVAETRDLRKGDRLFEGAPPTIPHSLLMRENCNACHAGPAARPEIRCTHTERVNCKQCHVPSLTTSAFPES